MDKLPPLRFTHRPKADEKLPDGFVRAGWRIVRKGGVITFHDSKWRHDDLVPYVGAFVYCEIEDMWAISIQVFPEGWSYEKAKRYDFLRPEPVK